MGDIDLVLERHEKVVSEEPWESPLSNAPKFKSYAVTNFRGGIGKTTLSFNLAYELSKQNRAFFVDVCPQKNFSELLLKQDAHNEDSRTIYDALLAKVVGGAWDATEGYDGIPLAKRVRDANREFENCKLCHAIPGSSELFLFPSQLYTQLNQIYSMTGTRKTKVLTNLLNSLKQVILEESFDLKPDVTLIDTSPFFAGGTHLAWHAAEALIIPVRVDEQSIYALELTLRMLHDPNSEFHQWRERAEIEAVPKVQAIAITHCGWNRQAKNSIDNTSKTFIGRALELAERYADCFATERPADHFAILQDFQSSGKISGALAIPIDKLEDGQFFTVDGRRLEANKSVHRCKKEIAYLASLIM